MTAFADLKEVLSLIRDYLNSELERIQTIKAAFGEKEEAFFADVKLDRNQKTKLKVDFSIVVRGIEDMETVVCKVRKDMTCLIKDLEQGVISESFKRLLDMAILDCTKLLVSKMDDDADEKFLSLLSKAEDAAKKL